MDTQRKLYRRWVRSILLVAAAILAVTMLLCGYLVQALILQGGQEEMTFMSYPTSSEYLIALRETANKEMAASV